MTVVLVFSDSAAVSLVLRCRKRTEEICVQLQCVNWYWTNIPVQLASCALLTDCNSYSLSYVNIKSLLVIVNFCLFLSCTVNVELPPSSGRVLVTVIVVKMLCVWSTTVYVQAACCGYSDGQRLCKCIQELHSVNMSMSARWRYFRVM